MLEKGVDPNIIDVNMNISVFTQIIIVIINYIHQFINNNNMEYTSYFKPFLEELIKYGADWEYGLENNAPLRDQYLDILNSYRNVPKVAFSPKKSILDNILNYSKSTLLETNF